MDPRGRIRAGGDEAKRTASGLLPLGPAFPLRGAAGLGAIASVARAAKAKGAMRYRLCFGPLRNLWYAQAALSPVRRSYAPTLARNMVGHEARPAVATRGARRATRCARVRHGPAPRGALPSVVVHLRRHARFQPIHIARQCIIGALARERLPMGGDAAQWLLFGLPGA